LQKLPQFGDFGAQCRKLPVLIRLDVITGFVERVFAFALSCSVKVCIALIEAVKLLCLLRIHGRQNNRK
jgi:hypothetical protein